MSYQVLARKWRPHSFAEVVGQKHVTRALINALEQQRLHHAYLFTGTRGIGKTSLARILTKCFNCETGITSTPCGKCSACEEIDTGRFIDLIEVDAASRTKVEDTRELLDNVQYAPTRGRYKIYLIDEVHMLSGHSFNALLKTLEEPPEHVKFLLATTDPQKLPVTVLSRCLQFNLKNLDPELITAHLETILKQEQIAYEVAALQKIARAADGSVRDSLSLLDQAIAYGNNKVTATDVNAMLGAIEDKYLFTLLEALAANNADKILVTIKTLAEQTADFAGVLADLIALLHQLALIQIAPEIDCYNKEQLQALLPLFTPEDIQLYYQIALIGRRDLPLATTPKHGFEMVMLRMLTFRPVTTKPQKWHEILPQLELSESTKALATHCSMEEVTSNKIQLLLNQKHAPMLNQKHEERLNTAFTKLFNKPMQVKINIGDAIETPNEIQTRKDSAKQQQAEQTINQDSTVQALMETFNATSIPDSITYK